MRANPPTATIKTLSESHGGKTPGGKDGRNPTAIRTMARRNEMKPNVKLIAPRQFRLSGVMRGSGNTQFNRAVKIVTPATSQTNVRPGSRFPKSMQWPVIAWIHALATKMSLREASCSSTMLAPSFAVIAGSSICS